MTDILAPDSSSMIRAISGSGPASAVQMPGHLFIHYNRAKKVQRHLQLFEQGMIGGPKQRTMFMFGPTGSGKSQLIKFAFPSARRKIRRVKRNGEDKNVLDVLLISAPGNGTARSILAEILLQLSIPTRKSESAQELLHRVKAILGGLETSLLVVDEMQQFTSSDYPVSDMIKNLTDGLPCRSLLVGLADLNEFAKLNPQLAHRLAIPIALPAFEWRSQSDQTDFVGLLKQFQRYHPIAFAEVDITKDALPKTLHHASRGLIGELTAILADAISFARLHRRETIKLDDLKKAVKKMLKSFEGRDNPFELEVLPAISPAAPLHSGINVNGVRNRRAIKRGR